MKLKDLIGYRLINIDEKGITIENENKQYFIEIEEDEGDCCGYNCIETKLLISEKDNPIITSVEEIIDENNDGSSKRITFYGTNKKIATLNSLSSSGSGWTYGACVTIKCNELNIKEILTSY